MCSYFELGSGSPTIDRPLQLGRQLSLEASHICSESIAIWAGDCRGFRSVELKVHKGEKKRKKKKNITRGKVAKNDMRLDCFLHISLLESISPSSKF